MSLVMKIARRVFVAGLLVTLATTAHAAPPAPVYSLTLPDAITGDAAGGSGPQNFNVPSVNCTNCRVPDPNPPAGSSAVDNYTLDTYERPTGTGGSADNYYTALDIELYEIGFDSEYLYFRVGVFGIDNQGTASTKRLPYFYSYEINFDADNRGDLFVRSDDPSNNGLDDVFGTTGVTAYWDENNNVGSSNPTEPDGPGGGGANSGYDTQVYQQGTNNVAGQPGGSDAVQARTILIGSKPYVELAVKRVFLNALKGSAVTQASFRPFVSKSGGTTTPSNLPNHDQFGRQSAGSPYPWLQLAGAPNTCPNSNAGDDNLTASERAALNSGTNVATANLNPCYPPGGNLAEFDNAGSIGELASGIMLSFAPPTVAKTFSPASVNTNTVSTVTITLTAANSTTVTGVSFTDTFPTSPGQMALANTTTTNSCGGTLTDGGGASLNAGDVAIRLSGGSVPGSGSCVVTFQVSAPILGSYVNSTGAVTTSNAGTASAASATLTVRQPLTLVKSLQTISDPINGGTNPKAIPGAFVLYTLLVSNPAAAAVDVNSVIVLDAMPANIDLLVNDAGGAGSGPVAFINGSPVSGLSYTFTSLASATDDVSFSNDGGTTFTYTPTLGVNGVDGAVTHLRINPKGTFNATSSFQLRFRVRVE